jgi:hypothetical protein
MPAQAESVESVYAQNCNQGTHQQPEGVFAIYVFCDDALGTNVAVFMQHIGAPLFGDYKLGKRFWQDEEWSYDVTSFSWLKDNRLLLATSSIYGSGKVFLLDLENQAYRVFREGNESDCLTHIKSIADKVVKIGLTDCETLKEKVIEIAL